MLRYKSINNLNQKQMTNTSNQLGSSYAIAAQFISYELLDESGLMSGNAPKVQIPSSQARFAVVDIFDKSILAVYDSFTQAKDDLDNRVAAVQSLTS